MKNIDILKQYRQLITAKEVKNKLPQYSISYINMVLNPENRRKDADIVKCAKKIIKRKLKPLLKAQ